MIPVLDPEAHLQPPYPAFIEAVRLSGFEGDVHTDYASRLVVATDNSVYQQLPAAVLLPRHEADVQVLARLTSEPRFAEVKLSPRGGGTGTNGQSLCTGVIVDLSRHMAGILELNLEEGWVRVQPGVVLDQLNQYLEPHGVFFAPNLSPSSRATLGGMISTDAAGKGSRIYGKTSNHVLALRTVLLDGSALESEPLSPQALEAACARSDLQGEVHRTVREVATRSQALVEAQFPKLKRFLTGYDLAHVFDAEGRFNLCAVLCGSEGTLGFLTEARLRLTPVPRHRALVAVRYAEFDAALRAATRLAATRPGAIETIDDTIVTLAQGDSIWASVAHLIEAPGEGPLAAINLVEYESHEASEVEERVASLSATLSAERGQPGMSTGFVVAKEKADIQALWSLRKKGVGLLGNAKGERRPVPFVEDTAVPPEHLADYIREFRKILDSHGLRYGMFGHVDVGCLHVRPALNLRDPADERLLRSISDQVVELVRRYGGVLWAEHGKGYRSEYSPTFFGPELYEELRAIKGAFDAKNQLNPGKLATPKGTQHRLLTIEQPTRGQLDRQIAPEAQAQFAVAIHCNGNGACFDFDPDHVMCPSAKVTRNRIHSPKGRAGMLREWLRLLAQHGYKGAPGAADYGSHLSLGAMGPEASADGGAALATATATATTAATAEPGASAEAAPRAKAASSEGRGDLVTSSTRRSDSGPKRLPLSGSRAAQAADFSHEVYDAMNGCLACKACATQCPVKVDIPEMRAHFFHSYHERYRRPLKDYFTASLEGSLASMQWAPGAFNAVMGASWFRALLDRQVGIVDPPPLSRTRLAPALRKLGAPRYHEGELAGLSPQEKDRTVLLVQDPFTTYYETSVAVDVYRALTALGLRAVFLPFKENGKALHVKGFLPAFRKRVEKNADYFSRVAKLGIAMVGIEPATTLTYREEYPSALGCEPEGMGFQVQLLQEYLSARFEKQAPAPAQAGLRYHLFSHCTERTAAQASGRQWQSVFRALGVELCVESLGCCGMCGVFGHESEHRDESRGIFEMSWGRRLGQGDLEPEQVLAQGHSCRSQVKRFAGFVPRHPLQVLAEALGKAG